MRRVRDEYVRDERAGRLGLAQSNLMLAEHRAGPAEGADLFWPPHWSVAHFSSDEHHNAITGRVNLHW